MGELWLTEPSQLAVVLNSCPEIVLQVSQSLNLNGFQYFRSLLILHISIAFYCHPLHTAFMSKRLKGMIDAVLVKEGRTAGKARLAAAVGKHPLTVTRWIKTGKIPEPNDRYKVALACGCSEEDSLAIAKETSSEATEKAG